jgi:hypothetical protein
METIHDKCELCEFHLVEVVLVSEKWATLQVCKSCCQTIYDDPIYWDEPPNEQYQKVSPQEFLVSVLMDS